MAVTDDFNRAALGANWTTIDGGGLSIDSSTIVKGVTGGDYNAAIWNANSFNATQTSQITDTSVAHYVAPIVRGSAGGNWYGYFSHGEIHKAVGGSITAIVTGEPTLTNGDVGLISASGTTLEWFKNAVSEGTVTDSSLSSGSAGIGTYDTTGRADNWEGTGEVAAGAASLFVPRRSMQHMLVR